MMCDVAGSKWVLWAVLQANESSKAKSRLNSSVDTGSIQAIRSRVPGNSHCADCDAASMYLHSTQGLGGLMLPSLQ
jgi:hypothetical protein